MVSDYTKKCLLYFFLQFIFFQEEQSNIWTAPGLSWLVDSWLCELVIGWWQWGGTLESDDWWLVLPRLVVAKMYVVILFLCVRVCVCGAEIFQGMANQPGSVSGTILEGMRDVCEFFTLDCMCVDMLLWIHMYAYLRLCENVCVFSAGGQHEKHLHSGYAAPALIDLPCHPYAKLTPPQTDSLLPVESR